MAATKKQQKQESATTDQGTESNKLYRSEINRILGGVSSGLALFFKVDATLIRVLFVLLTLFGGSGLIIYLILWVIIPTESAKETSLTSEDLRKNLDEIGDKAREITESFETQATTSNSRSLLGMIIVGVGAVILLSNFGVFHFINFEKLWPLVIVAIGIALLFRDKKN
jgi:phage shock protein C